MNCFLYFPYDIRYSIRYEKVLFLCFLLSFEYLWFTGNLKKIERQEFKFVIATFGVRDIDSNERLLFTSDDERRISSLLSKLNVELD